MRVLFALILMTLVVLLFIAPSAAFEGRGETAGVQKDQAAVAWQEDDMLFVAIANTERSRGRFTLALIGAGTDGKTLKQIELVVPGYSVLVESISLESDGRAWRDDHPVHDAHPRWGAAEPQDMAIKEIQLDNGSRSVIPVQHSDGPISAAHFVIGTDTILEIDVDIEAVLDQRTSHRLVVDPTYTIVGSDKEGTISISALDGGIELDTAASKLTSSQPGLSLEMRTPGLRDAGLLTFEIVHYDAQNRSEVLDSPIVLVVGNDYRWIDNTSVSSERISR